MTQKEKIMYKKTILKNGLRVITVPQPDNMAATVLVMVEAGSKYEQKEINGLSHLSEHLSFKSTTNRPTAMAIADLPKHLAERLK